MIRLIIYGAVVHLFIGEVVSDCGGSLTGSGLIQSPDYPYNYSGGLNCTWFLEASPLTGAISLEFQAFSTEAGRDYLSVFNNTAQINRFSGSDIPAAIHFIGNAILQFTSYGFANLTGFSIRFNSNASADEHLSPSDLCYQQGCFYCNRSNQCIESWFRCNGLSDCNYGEDETDCPTTTARPRAPGTQSATTMSASISCAQQGRAYCNQSRQCIPASYWCDGNVDCDYGEDESGCTTTTTARTTTRGTQSATTMSASESCAQQGRAYCNQSRQCIPTSYWCDGYAHCYYGEDESRCTTTTTTRGPGVPACGGNFTGSGIIQSPGYPSSYSHNLLCTWNLHASPANSSIVLTFQAFSTESGYDFLRIIDGQTQLTRTYSGPTVPSTITLGSEARLVFTSDSSVVSFGFSILFTSVVLPVTTTISPMDSCVLQGRFYCNRSIQCIYLSLRCNGYYECFYGEDETGCSSNPTTRPQTTAGTPSGTTLSDRDTCIQQGQFYCEQSRQCVPSSYRCSGYQYCTYGEDEVGCSTTVRSITAAGTSFASTPSARDSCIQQGAFYCEQSRECVPSWYRCDGYRYCTYGEDEVGCGTTAQSTTAAGTSFARDSCILQGGFYCEQSRECAPSWSRCSGSRYCTYGEDEVGCGTTARSTTAAASTCGGYLLVGSGTIKSPNYPLSYPNNVICEWNLQANPYDSKIILQFLRFDTESCCDHLRVYDDSGRVYSFSGSSIPSTIIVGRSGRIVFSSDGSGVRSGFFLSLNSLSSAASVVRRMKIPYMLVVMYMAAPLYV